jgi:hypothetical protein
MNEQHRQHQIGIDRLIRLRWLEETANLALNGMDKLKFKEMLTDSLAADFPSSKPDVRGSLSKTITVLMKTWVQVPPGLEELRDRGLILLKTSDRKMQLPVHWGMLMAAYPFWGSTAMHTGRLLRLQGTVAAAQVQRRLCEQYGERETVSRRARYALRSFIDWGVLSDTGTQGIYKPTPPLAINDTRIVAWLAEASLHSRVEGLVPLKELFDSPYLFPFLLKPMYAADLAVVSTGIEILRHGLDDDLVMLRRGLQS